MTAGIFARVPRLAVLVPVALLATATLTLAATSTVSAPPAAAPVAASAEPAPLVVPDVRRQAYVFAKGTLEQGGFAWRVEGSVQGYAANLVASQTPAPGSKLIADGAPTIVLRLEQNTGYAQEGSPENESPFAGRPARVLGAVPLKTVKPTSAKPKVTKPKVAAPKAVASAAAGKPAAPKPVARKAATRPPAFVRRGAPAEPLDEITLVARATQLGVWVDAQHKRTPAAVNRWLYQHSWIVTGASFGWSGGAAALRRLIAVDVELQKRWGVGARSEKLARRTLATVEARSR